MSDDLCDCCGGNMLEDEATECPGCCGIFCLGCEGGVDDKGNVWCTNCFTPIEKETP